MNPVWNAFCAGKMEDWLEWLRTIHVNSYLELTERFIATHPFFVPKDASFSDKDNQLFERLVMDWNFIQSLSDKGLLVWANSNFEDFIEALEPYGIRYPDIRRLTTFLRLHLEWFTRVYQFYRADLILELREAGRNL
ncbi:MAG TPA: hypothetical protein DHN29_05350 [Cytophagales bacterium]|jgi:hypothetical protein|nr:hypothetical protein [Cytophagales bacterium]